MTREPQNGVKMEAKNETKQQGTKKETRKTRKKRVNGRMGD